MGRALITGASAGLGLEFAWTLAAEGNDLVLVARSADKLEAIAEDIRQKAHVNVEVLPADLSKPADVDVVAARLIASARPIGLLVNNAGFGLGQDFVGGKIERELEALNVMVRAVLVLSHAASGAMVKRKYGTIINVSSMSSLTAQGTYSAHKAWVRTFTEGLAAELKGTGVNASAVCPGLIHTDFHKSSGVDPRQWADITFSMPEDVVEAALNAARRGKVLVTPTPLYKAAAGALKFLPRSIVRKVAGPGLSGRD